MAMHDSQEFHKNVSKLETNIAIKEQKFNAPDVVDENNWGKELRKARLDMLLKIDSNFGKGDSSEKTRVADMAKMLMENIVEKEIKEIIALKSREKAELQKMLKKIHDQGKELYDALSKDLSSIDHNQMLKKFIKDFQSNKNIPQWVKEAHLEGFDNLNQMRDKLLSGIYKGYGVGAKQGEVRYKEAISIAKLLGITFPGGFSMDANIIPKPKQGLESLNSFLDTHIKDKNIAKAMALVPFVPTIKIKILEKEKELKTLEQRGDVSAYRYGLEPEIKKLKTELQMAEKYMDHGVPNAKIKALSDEWRNQIIRPENYNAYKAALQNKSGESSSDSMALVNDPTYGKVLISPFGFKYNPSPTAKNSEAIYDYKWATSYLLAAVGLGVVASATAPFIVGSVAVLGSVSGVSTVLIETGLFTLGYNAITALMDTGFQNKVIDEQANTLYSRYKESLVEKFSTFREDMIFGILTMYGGKFAHSLFKRYNKAQVQKIVSEGLPNLNDKKLETIILFHEKNIDELNKNPLLKEKSAGLIQSSEEIVKEGKRIKQERLNTNNRKVTTKKTEKPLKTITENNSNAYSSNKTNKAVDKSKNKIFSKKVSENKPIKKVDNNVVPKKEPSEIKNQENTNNPKDSLNKVKNGITFLSEEKAITKVNEKLKLKLEIILKESSAFSNKNSPLTMRLMQEIGDLTDAKVKSSAGEALRKLNLTAKKIERLVNDEIGTDSLLYQDYSSIRGLAEDWNNCLNTLQRSTTLKVISKEGQVSEASYLGINSQENILAKAIEKSGKDVSDLVDETKILKEFEEKSSNSLSILDESKTLDDFSTVTENPLLQERKFPAYTTNQEVKSNFKEHILLKYEGLCTDTHSVDQKIVNILSKELEDVTNTINSKELLSNTNQQILLEFSQRFLYTYRLAMKLYPSTTQVSNDEVFQLLRDNLKKLLHQQLVDSKNITGSDHGIKHILNNIKMQEEIIAGLSYEVTPKERILLFQAMIDHDIGYTNNYLTKAKLGDYFGMTKDHPLLSGIYMKSKIEYYNHIFGDNSGYVLHGGALDHSNAAKVDLKLAGSNGVTENGLRGRVVTDLAALTDCSAATADTKIYALMQYPQILDYLSRMAEQLYKFNSSKEGQQLSALKKSLKNSKLTQQIEGKTRFTNVKTQAAYESLLDIENKMQKQFVAIGEEAKAWVTQTKDISENAKPFYKEAMDSYFKTKDPAFMIERDLGAYAGYYKEMTVKNDKVTTVFVVDEKVMGHLNRIGKEGLATKPFVKIIKDYVKGGKSLKDVNAILKIDGRSLQNGEKIVLSEKTIYEKISQLKDNEVLSIHSDDLVSDVSFTKNTKGIDQKFLDLSKALDTPFTINKYMDGIREVLEKGVTNTEELEIVNKSLYEVLELIPDNVTMYNQLVILKKSVVKILKKYPYANTSLSVDEQLQVQEYYKTITHWIEARGRATLPLAS